MFCFFLQMLLKFVMLAPPTECRQSKKCLVCNFSAISLQGVLLLLRVNVELELLGVKLFSAFRPSYFLFSILFFFRCESTCPSLLTSAWWKVLEAGRHPSLLTEAPLFLPLLLLGCINPSVSRHWWDGADLRLPVSSALTLLETLRCSLVSEPVGGFSVSVASSDNWPGRVAAPPLLFLGAVT